MPQPTLPPTPASSTDLKGKQDDAVLRSNVEAFDLPPAAMSSRYALSEDAHADRIHQSGRTRKDDLYGNSKSNGRSLPPPPVRSRKIIQMKPKPRPRTHQAHENGNDMASLAPGPTGKTKVVAASESKKKQGNGSSSGRKIARKTAHSLIERRRRSKMNEEFGVLKDMIPACAGQDMHKLAILQASIDYVRYLKRCLEHMPNHHSRAESSAVSSPLHSNKQGDDTSPNLDDDENGPSEDSDGEDRPCDEMEVDDSRHEEHRPVSALQTWYKPFAPGSDALTPTSPPFSAKSSAYLPVSSVPQCELPSPAYSAGLSYERLNGPFGQSSSRSAPTQTSPALLPQTRGSNSASQLDHEASTALLMLNALDRRDSFTQKVAVSAKPERPGSAFHRSGSRSISVKDLLSS